jgi:hypothetical protein
MAGYDFCDVACWETAWQFYVGELGARPSRCLMGELPFWVRSIRKDPQRPLCYFPQGCRHLCYDECMALSVVSAAQSEDSVAGYLAIRHLTGLDDPDAIGDVWAATQGFAEALMQFSQPLYPVPSTVIESIAKKQLLSNVTSITLN